VPSLSAALDAAPTLDQHRDVWNWLLRMSRRFARVVDDALPMPPDQREARDWFPESDTERSKRRLLRLKLHMLEKRGKGGYR
jgi:hypothetical protein